MLRSRGTRSITSIARWNRSSSFSTVMSRSEEHTSELQSRVDLVCRLLLEKKKTKKQVPVEEDGHRHGDSRAHSIVQTYPRRHHHTEPLHGSAVIKITDSQYELPQQGSTNT